MARRRLTGTDPETLFRTRNENEAAPETKSLTRLSPGLSAPPPIARVTGESAAEAALAEVTRGLADLRAAGLVVQLLPLDSVVPDHLLRDRILADDADMAALKASICAHGQRQPIDVCPLPARNGAPCWGLISGWRRLLALKELRSETGETRFEQVRALVRQPGNAADSYVAMIEENEIRADLSHYERARIVALAVESGVFAHDREGLQALFGNVSRAKRSKIGSFMDVYRMLDADLRFPRAIGERLGLRLAAAIGEGQGRALVAALQAGGAGDAEAEQSVLERALAALQGRAPAKAAQAEEITPGVLLTTTRQGSRLTITLRGDMVDERLLARVRKAAGG